MYTEPQSSQSVLRASHLGTVSFLYSCISYRCRLPKMSNIIDANYLHHMQIGLDRGCESSVTFQRNADVISYQNQERVKINWQLEGTHRVRTHAVLLLSIKCA